MSENPSREAAILQHEIIEAAKVAWKEDSTLPFVQHLDIEARARCGTEWKFETSCRRDGVWGLTLEYAAPAAYEPLYHDPSLI